MNSNEVKNNKYILVFSLNERIDNLLTPKQMVSKVERPVKINSSEYRIIKEISKRDLKELEETGITFVKFYKEFCILGNTKRINVHRIENPICRDLITTSLPLQQDENPSSENESDRIPNSSSIKLLISYLGQTINQFKDVLFMNDKYCFTRRENQIYKNNLFFWGRGTVLKIPDIILKNDLIRKGDCHIKKEISNEIAKSQSIFSLIYIYNDKLVYRIGQVFYYDDVKINIQILSLGYKEWIISVGERIEFFSLKTLKVEKIIEKRIEKKINHLRVVERINEQFLNIDGVLFFGLEEVMQKNLPHCSGLVGNFAKKFGLIKWAFSTNIREISGLIFDRIQRNTINNTEELNIAKTNILNVIEEIVQNRNIDFTDNLYRIELKRAILYNIQGLKCLVHSEMLKTKSAMKDDIYLIFLFFYHTKDHFFLNMIVLLCLQISNDIRLFTFNDISKDILKDNKIETYKILKSTIKAIFRPSKYNRDLKTKKIIAKELLFEEKINFSDLDFENKRKKAACLRNQCFIGDSLIEFGWTGKFIVEKEEMNEKIPDFHENLRKFKWQRIKNAGWENFKNRFLYSNDFITENSNISTKEQKDIRIRDANNRKMNEKIKEILCESNQSEQNENPINLLYKFLTNTDVPMKILEETIQNENISDFSRLAFSVLYCIREKALYMGKSTRHSRTFGHSKTLGHGNNLSFTNTSNFDQNISINDSFTLVNESFTFKNLTYSTSSDCFSFIDVKNGIVSLLLNGILNISSVSQLSIDKMRRSPQFNKPEEVFFSEIFILIIQLNKKRNIYEMEDIEKLMETNFDNADSKSKKAEFSVASYYAVAGRLFFIALYFLFLQKNYQMETLNDCKKLLLKKCLEWEERMKTDENFTVIFNYALVSLSLLENAGPVRKLNINLIRILRRKIFETKEYRNYTDEETFFVNVLSLIEDDDLYEEDSLENKFKVTGGFSLGPVNFGHIELYKICFGLCLLKSKNLYLKGTNSGTRQSLSTPAIISISYLFLIFFPIWPSCPEDQIEFHQMRNLIFLLLERGKEKYTFKRRKSQENFKFLKYVTDILSDFAERNNENRHTWRDLISMVVNNFM